MDLTSNASHAGLKAYRRTEDYQSDQRFASPRKAGSDFRRGVCARLGARIHVHLDLEKTPQASGTGIVVVKNALIRQWLQDHNMGFKSACKVRVGQGYNRGKEYAEGVGIGRGVGTQRSGQLALR
jgi:hypothetical protein